VAGCQHGPKGASAGPGRTGSANTNTLIVTPSGAIRGRIIVVNPSARYVILSYPLGHIPQPERRLAVYRNGLKVADIKVGTQRMDTNAVADIMTGECQAGDEVRDE
jgi:hypothetical protein